HAQRRAGVPVRRARLRLQRHYCGQPREAQAHAQRPYACDKPGCWYSATTASNLTTHKAYKRTHSGERPFACNEPGCDFKAAQASTLNKHKRTHSQRS
ncbi:hypothetical protein T492DRAFT_884752, partial [Pavlovales sp. CCMP2436]